MTTPASVFKNFGKVVFFVWLVTNPILSQPLLASSLTANFSGSSTDVDGYAGGYGSGTWLSAWTIKQSNMSYTASVESSSPLASGSGYYLHLSTTSAGSTSSANISVSRQYASSGGGSLFDLSQAIQYQFSFRAGQTSSSTYSSDSNYNSDACYYIYDATSALSGISDAATWIIKGRSTWQLYSSTGSYINTGVNIAPNTTYVFNITATPSSTSWIVTISDTIGTVLYSSLTTGDSLGYRSGATLLGGYLEFNINDYTASSSTTLSCDIDSITISQIPETQTTLLLMMGMGCLFLLHYLRTKKLCSI